MGFLDAQLAQGYSVNYSQRLGLIDKQDAQSINNIMNGLELVDHVLSLGIRTAPERFSGRPRPAEPGSYRSTAGDQFGKGLENAFRSSSEFRINLRFTSIRFGRSAEERAKSEKYRRFKEDTRVGVRRGEKAALRRAELRAIRAARRIERLRILRRAIKIVRFL